MMIIILMLSLALLVTACTSMAPPLNMPPPPTLRSETVTINIPTTNNQPARENIVQMRGHIIPYGSTIVISVPRTITQQLMQQTRRISDRNPQRANQISSKSVSDINDAPINVGNDFFTSGYFHTAEQQIEKELIRHGFDVLSREKFEAKLRNARGSARVKGLYELTDISEVIRAAEKGDLTADYLLQINQFKLNDINDYDINLGAFKDYQKLMDHFPQVRDQLKKAQYLKCSEYSATLNAKLIHVASGQIIWIGEHSASTRGLLENALAVRVGVEEEVVNKEQIERFVAAQNTESARKNRDPNKPVKLPEWEIRAKVLKPIVTNGYCRIEKSSISREQVRSQLSKLVASTLMRSIRVGPPRRSLKSSPLSEQWLAANQSRK